MLRSYRKVGVTKTIITEPNDNGATFLTISLKAILALTIIYGLISFIMPFVIPISASNGAHISEDVEDD